MALGRPGEKGKEHCNPDTSRSSGRSLENLRSSGGKLLLCTASSIQRLTGHLQVLLTCRSCAPGPDAPVFPELFYLLGLRAFLQQRRVPALSPESPADPAPPWALPVLCRSFPSLLLPLISEQFPAWFDLIFTALQPHTCAQTLQKCTRGLRWWDAPRGAPTPGCWVWARRVVAPHVQGLSLPADFPWFSLPGMCFKPFEERDCGPREARSPGIEPGCVPASSFPGLGGCSSARPKTSSSSCHSPLQKKNPHNT